MDRRQLLQSAIAAALLPWCSPGVLAASETSSPPRTEYGSDISIILPQEPKAFPPEEGLDTYQHRLNRAVLDMIQDHYAGRSMPVWDRPPEEVDLETRISNIIYWVLHSVRKHAGTYFVDPAWIMAQIMEESFFDEFAVSWSFASGVCQFTIPTAKSFGMVCPDTSRLQNAQLRQPEQAGALDRLKALQTRKSKLTHAHEKLFHSQDELFRESLRHHLRGDSLPEAEQWLQALEEMDALEESIRGTRKEYREFLMANYRGRSIFNRQDLDFLLRFDQRVTYDKPIEAMIKMMTRYMKGRNGNILVATAGYNAGLSRTYFPYAVYEPYGLIPNFEETVSYVSKIVINHHEIVQRMSG
jgi:hypothetical protein